MFTFIFVVIWLVTEAKESVKSNTFQIRKSSDGQKLCAIDEPTFVKLMPFGSALKCGAECGSYPGCTAFNFNVPLTQCDIYQYVPQNFDTRSGCYGYFYLGLSVWPDFFLTHSNRCARFILHKGRCLINGHIERHRADKYL